MNDVDYEITFLIYFFSLELEGRFSFKKKKIKYIYTQIKLFTPVSVNQSCYSAAWQNVNGHQSISDTNFKLI